MLKRLLASALFAGLAAGTVAAFLQLWLIVPLILEAELYETGALAHAPATGTEHIHAVSEAQDGAGLVRHALTFFMNLVTYSGLGLVLVAGMALAERAGRVMTVRDGLFWGAAGFVAVQLAPSAGLPPELPGMPAADLAARQTWWAVTVLASGGGLALLAFGRRSSLVGAGLVLLLAPHLYGAPQPALHGGVVPPDLAALFASRSLAAGAAVWALLGVTAAYFWNRQAPA